MYLSEQIREVWRGGRRHTTVHFEEGAVLQDHLSNRVVLCHIGEEERVELSEGLQRTEDMPDVLFFQSEFPVSHEDTHRCIGGGGLTSSA